MERFVLTRRTFLADLGRFSLGVSVLGLAACSAQSDESPSSSTTSAATSSSTTSPPDTTTTTAGTTSTTPVPSGIFEWRAVDLGRVAAVVLVSGGEAVLVDTGNPGRADDIEETLGALGAGWGDLGHVIVTHRHGDHVGNLGNVMNAAPDATGYAGAGDVDAIRSPRPLQVVGDGDTVFGLEIIETPGHTPGHISVLDRMNALLIAGDALNGAGSGVEGADSGVGGANPQFTADMAIANDSILKLAGLSFDTIVFGHGTALEEGGASAVAELAAGL